MKIPTADTPLYNHPLPAIEAWLVKLGCRKNTENIHCWTVEKLTKTLLDKTFRLFVNPKVPDLGVSGGKIQVLFP